MPTKHSNLRALLLCFVLGLAAAGVAHADSVSQIATGVRISRTTAALLDPQGRPGGSVVGTAVPVTGAVAVAGASGQGAETVSSKF